MNIKYVLKRFFLILWPLLVAAFFSTFSDYVQSLRLDLSPVLADDRGLMAFAVMFFFGLIDWLSDIWRFLRALWSWFRQRLSVQ